MLLYSLTIMILRSVRIGDNGWYVPEDGSIHIDLYAGADGKGTMLFTAAHELTHFIKDQSPEKFQALSDFLMEQYGKKGVPVQALVEEQMAKARKHGNALDPDGAFEEVVADSMESMLTDGKVLQELKQRDKGLWQTVKDYVLELCEKIRKVYKGLKPDSLEGRIVSEMRDAAEEMRRLFMEGLVDAGENFRGAASAEFASAQEEKHYSLRDIDIERNFINYGDSVAEKNAINRIADDLESRGKFILVTDEQVAKHIDVGRLGDFKAARVYLKSILKDFMGGSVYFKDNGNYAEAYLTKAGVDHSVGGVINPENTRNFRRELRYKSSKRRKRKSLQTAKTACRLSFLAEWVGFEPTAPEGTTDFESVPL